MAFSFNVPGYKAFLSLSLTMVITCSSIMVPALSNSIIEMYVVVVVVVMAGGYVVCADGNPMIKVQCYELSFLLRFN